MEKQSFADLGVSNTVTAALARRGIHEPFPVQRLVLADVLAGHDVLVKSPTGSGKTLAFGVPLAERIGAPQQVPAGAPQHVPAGARQQVPVRPAGRQVSVRPAGRQASGRPADDQIPARPAALVLAPTRELASQIVDELSDIVRACNLRVTAVYGGVGLAKQAALAAKSHILVATPGRLEDLLQRRAFTLDEIRILVLDEADRMLDMGFRPAIDRIVAACPAERQTLFFSATLDGVAGRIAARYTKRPITHEHGEPGQYETADIEHRFVAIRENARLQTLVDELGCERDRALVFVRTKRGADRLVKRLGASGVEALAIHGNKSQGQRERALASFRSGRVDTLVATDVAARGIDVDGISHVINFDPPDNHDTYVHRIGRTGRAGRQGIGITLVGAGEQHEMRELARRLGLTHGLGGNHEHSGPPASSASRQQRSRRRRRAASAVS
jgi:ATP-dependent RNA helicase RhlE